MNKIIDTIFEESLSLKYDLENSELIEQIEQIRMSHNISMDNLIVSISDLITDEGVDLVAYAYKKGFIHSDEYTRNDVILELKLHLWSYLFPENELDSREKSLVFELLQIILKNCHTNDHWLLASDLRLITSKLIGKDFFDGDNFLQKLFFADKIEFQKNVGIDINGFKNYNSSVRWKSPPLSLV